MIYVHGWKKPQDRGKDKINMIQDMILSAHHQCNIS